MPRLQRVPHLGNNRGDLLSVLVAQPGLVVGLLNLELEGGPQPSKRLAPQLRPLLVGQGRRGRRRLQRALQRLRALHREACRQGPRARGHNIWRQPVQQPTCDEGHLLAVHIGLSGSAGAELLHPREREHDTGDADDEDLHHRGAAAVQVLLRAPVLKRLRQQLGREAPLLKVILGQLLLAAQARAVGCAEDVQQQSAHLQGLLPDARRLVVPAHLEALPRLLRPTLGGVPLGDGGEGGKARRLSQRLRQQLRDSLRERRFELPEGDVAPGRLGAALLPLPGAALRVLGAPALRRAPGAREEELVHALEQLQRDLPRVPALHKEELHELELPELPHDVFLALAQALLPLRELLPEGPGRVEACGCEGGERPTRLGLVLCILVAEKVLQQVVLVHGDVLVLVLRLRLPLGLQSLRGLGEGRCLRHRLGAIRLAVAVGSLLVLALAILALVAVRVADGGGEARQRLVGDELAELAPSSAGGLLDHAGAGDIELRRDAGEIRHGLTRQRLHLARLVCFRAKRGHLSQHLQGVLQGLFRGSPLVVGLDAK
mmetsp:Transcript_74575/g.216343  ORF Transcript_74575/g.216343 Transcript_74575/m.216343 type:complete len:546 (-) Transcript_74575:851-2488(-)